MAEAAVASASGVLAAVLAGGAASRLGGRDKGLVVWRGRELVCWSVEAMANQVDEVLIVANRHLGDYARHARVVPDGNAGHRGPLEGIATALRVTRQPLVLVVPVDCPQPPADLARRLRSALDLTCRAAVAHDGERRQPLFALYDASFADSAQKAAQEDWPVWRWQNSIGVAEVDFHDCARRFRNLNSAADFEALDDIQHE
ncbi:MAG: molybdenum cofactor guanylyltransferase MobA [Tahibacter sp.]